MLPTLALNDAWNVPFRRVLGKHASTFGAVGVAYSAVECLAETMRGKDDFWNGVLGGFASGAVIAIRAGNPSTMFFTGASAWESFHNGNRYVGICLKGASLGTAWQCSPDVLTCRWLCHF